MKKFLASVLIAFSTLTIAFPAVTAEEPKTKKVCLDKLTKDGKQVMGKDGKPVQECKEVKIHKKLEGTQVPQK